MQRPKSIVIYFYVIFFICISIIFINKAKAQWFDNSTFLNNSWQNTYNSSTSFFNMDNSLFNFNTTTNFVNSLNSLSPFKSSSFDLFSRQNTISNSIFNQNSTPWFQQQLKSQSQQSPWSLDWSEPSIFRSSQSLDWTKPSIFSPIGGNNFSSSTVLPQTNPTQEIPDVVVNNEATLTDYSNSGCKSNDKRDTTEIEEYFDYKYEDNLLYLFHYNASYNCCIEEIAISMTIKSNIINIYEDEILEGSGCRCVCMYDLTSNIEDLLPGTYIAKFYNKDTGELLGEIKEIIISDNSLPRFKSCKELAEKLSKINDANIVRTAMYDGSSVMFASETSAPTAIAGYDQSYNAALGGSADYSSTNIQVAGVDEADIIKNDGSYIYMIKDMSIRIIRAYPYDKLEELSKINFEDSEFNPSQIYINKDRLVVIGSDYPKYEPIPMIDGEPVRTAHSYVGYYGYSTPVTRVIIYNISSPNNPNEERNIKFEGSYLQSRKVDDILYVVMNQYPNYYILDRSNDTLDNQSDVPLEVVPLYNDSLKSKEDDEPICDCEDVSYLPESEEANYLIVVAIPINDPSKDIGKEIVLGASQNVYSSRENLYVASTEYVRQILPTVIDEPVSRGVVSFSTVSSAEASSESVKTSFPTVIDDFTPLKEIAPVVDEGRVYDWAFSTDIDDPIMPTEPIVIAPEPIISDVIFPETNSEKTIVYKFKLNKEDIIYRTKKDVPGRIINQFSMDEHDNHFRIATTKGSTWDRENPSSNNVYVLDEYMEIVGKIEKIAPGETIKSVRFMGDIAYVVTFRTIDPFFVISLEDPENPNILGELKIPGYTQYLHPYDDDHIIGFGREVVDNVELGMKISLFDVTDLSNPIELHKEVIGYRYTNSELLYEHKALLFNRERNFMAFPINVTSSVNENIYGYEEMFKGAYIYYIDQNGFERRAEITHYDDEGFEKLSIYYPEYGYYYNEDIKRIIYIDDHFYTISMGKIKAIDMESYSVDNVLILEK